MATGEFHNEQKKVWSGWLIEELIGEGSYGKVYKISRTERGRKYFSAVKMITIPTRDQYKEAVESLGTDENSLRNYFIDMIDEIIDEVTILYSLAGYSNILGYFDHKIIDHGDDIGWDILIRMEYVKSLRKHLSEKQMTRGDVVNLGIDICNALELCSKKGIVHRDIKDENIFINSEGIYKLGDFGIAKIVSQNRSMASMRGTPLYMAPEVYKGIKYDARIDIYSLGLVLYKLLNNDRMPFLPNYPQPIRFRDNEKAISLRLSGETMPPPVNAGEELGKVILKACETNPDNRYNSAQAFKKKLLAVYEGMDEEERNELVTLISDKKIHKKQHTDRTESIRTDKSKKTERAVKPSDPSGKTEAIHFKPARKKPVHKKAVRNKSARKRSVREKPVRLKSNRKKKVLILLLNIIVIASIGVGTYFILNEFDVFSPEATPLPTPGNRIIFTPSPEPRQVFTFDEATGTIEDYDSSDGSDVIIPSEINGITVTKIAENAFSTKGLTSVIFPETITEIGKSAFVNNDLSEIILLDSLVSLGERAFADNNLTSLDLPDNLEIIEFECFANNKLTSLSITNGILRIEDQAFYLNNISSIYFPESLTFIGKQVFKYNRVEHIEIASNNTIIDEGMFFDNLNNFRDVYYDEINGGAGTYSGTQDGIWMKITDDDMN